MSRASDFDRIAEHFKKHNRTRVLVLGTALRADLYIRLARKFGLHRIPCYGAISNVASYPVDDERVQIEYDAGETQITCAQVCDLVTACGISSNGTLVFVNSKGQQPVDGYDFVV